MQYKTCSKCKIEKSTSEFHKRGTKFKSHCKKCRQEFEYLEDRDRHILRTKKAKEKSPEKYKELDRLCRERNKKERNEKQSLRRKNDTSFRITHNLRMRLNRAIKGIAKSQSTMELLGCTISDYLLYLESKFSPGMSFDNYGEWHIDHIVPCTSFDMTDPQQQKQCFHYSNTQPLWRIDNIRKSNR